MNHKCWFSLRIQNKGILNGFLAAVGMFFIGFSLSLLFGVIKITGFTYYPKQLAIDFLICLLIALYEEIICRGVVLGGLLKLKMNRFAALFLSSLLFGCLHLLNPGISLLSMINLILAGGMLGASFLYTRNLWFAISMHLFWNWIQGPVLGYGVSGNSFGFSLVNIQLSGSNLLSGGSFGFEGSIICTALTVCFIAITLYWYEKRARANKA